MRSADLCFQVAKDTMAYDSKNWYVITGGPSTGKTTLLLELEKLGHAIIPEAARTWIDQNLAKGLSIEQMRADEKMFQEDIARLKQKIESAHPADTLTFLDRGMHDTLAYLRHYGFGIEDWIQKAVEGSHYKKVFVLEPLAAFQKDYARTEDQDFTQKLTKLLHDAYKEYGMKPISVPAMPITQRVAFVLEHVDQA
jgi:predicted ATPase